MFNQIKQVIISSFQHSKTPSETFDAANINHIQDIHGSFNEKEDL